MKYFTYKPIHSLALLMSCIAVLAVDSGCSESESSDEYVGDIEKVLIFWETNHGARHVIILEPNKGGIPTLAYGQITKISVQLTQFPYMRLVVPVELAKKELIHPEGEAVISVRAKRARFRCRKGSRTVLSISF